MADRREPRKRHAHAGPRLSRVSHAASAWPAVAAPVAVATAPDVTVGAWTDVGGAGVFATVARTVGAVVLVGAVVDALVARTNVCAYFAYHTYSAVNLRPYDDRPDDKMPLRRSEPAGVAFLVMFRSRRALCRQMTGRGSGYIRAHRAERHPACRARSGGFCKSLWRLAQQPRRSL